MTTIVSEERQKFGNMVAAKLRERDITQTDLAKDADTDQPTISAIIRHRYACGKDLAERLASAFRLQGNERELFIMAAEGRLPARVSGDIEKRLVDCFMRELRAAGLDERGAVSVTEVAHGRSGEADIVVVMSDGSVIDIELKLKKRMKQS